MREILFRAREINTGKWAYGNYYYEAKHKFNPYFITWNGENALGNFGDRYNPVNNVLVDKDTVGQYTGLKDKHGRKIFEDDIVRVKRSYINSGESEFVNYIVVWKENWCAWGLIITGNAIQSCRLEPTETYEIIGNIFDNPELLGD